MKNNQKITLLFTKMLGFIYLSVFLFAACQKKAPSTFNRPPSPVSVAITVVQNVPVYLDEIGKCVAREVVSIQPQVSGRIIKIHFVDGANVKMGDLLFTIDPKPFEVELQRAQVNLAKDIALKKQAEANLVKDIAQAKNGETEAKRYADLFQKGDVSKEQYDQRRTNSESLEATVKANRAAIESAEESLKVDKAAIEAAKIQLNYCYIHAPINGRAGHRLVDLGNVTTPNNITPLLVIERIDPIYADFTISQNDLSTVQKNMAQGKLKTEISLPDEPNNSRTGELTFLDNTVQDSTGTVKLRATIPNNDYLFWPGRFVKVRLVLSTIQNAILIPAVAPQMSAKGQFVYVVKEDSTAELRPVTLGQKQGDLVVVDKGLQVGEKVVVNGQIAVTPGGKVHIQEPTASSNPSSSQVGGK